LNTNDPVAFNFLVLTAGITIVGYLLWLGFFRHESQARRMAGFAVVFVGFVSPDSMIPR
jgi:hydrogenase/urease accessory protein HupE